MQPHILAIFCFALGSTVSAFKQPLPKALATNSLRRYVAESHQLLRMSTEEASAEEIDMGPVEYRNIAVSGAVSKTRDRASPFIFTNLFSKGTIDTMKAITDDVSFARKRLVTPTTVYSGLFDVLDFALVPEDDTSELKSSLVGSDAWIAYAVDFSQVADYAKIAAQVEGLKRVVFAVHATDEKQQGPDILLEDVCKVLSDARVIYTIVKYAEVIDQREAKSPYRIVRAALPLSIGIHPDPEVTSADAPRSALNPRTPASPLSSDDLFRVILESVDLPKTFNSVYGIGPGTALDSEILTYMRSRGWPERVQVGLLMGDMMERIEVKFLEEQRRLREAAEKRDKAKASTDTTATGLPDPTKGNKYAGFFSE